VKWSGDIGMEMELLVVEVHREITNLVDRGDECHKEREDE